MVKYRINIQNKKLTNKNLYEEHLMRYFSLDELKNVLLNNNLKIIKNLGQDFKSLPNKKDWSVIAICQKN